MNQLNASNSSGKVDMRILKRFLFLMVSLILICNNLFAFRSVNRFIPFIERPDVNKINGFSNLNTTIFLGNAFQSFKPHGEHVGIPAVWGRYDLNQIINSLQLVQGSTFVNPFFTLPSSISNLSGKRIIFKSHGRIKSVGVTLEYEQNIFWNNFSVGAWIPLMRVWSNQTFEFDSEDSDPAAKALTSSQVEQLDKIRRSVQYDQMGLEVGEWEKSGFGDLDLYLRFYGELDYVLLMKAIRVNLFAGFLFPTDRELQLNNPASIPFMTNGHFGTYLDFISDFELKDDMKVGFIYGFIVQNKKVQRMRIPVTQEAYMFSPLVGTVKMRPGFTWKIGGYLTIENLIDGLNFQLKYQHIKHTKDTMIDERPINDRRLIPSNTSFFEDHSKWTADYITLDFSYNSREAFHHWKLSPTFYLTYDFPIDWFGAKGAAKDHKFTVGCELHF